MDNFWKGKRVLVTGGFGFLGSQVVERLDVEEAKCQIAGRGSDGGGDYDVIVHCAGKVGGMLENKEKPAEFIYDNLKAGLDYINRARDCKAKFINISSSCTYPGHVWSKLHPDNLWGGYPAKENGPYGIAKRAIIEVVRAYREQYGLQAYSLVFPNLYGPGMNTDPKTSHVIGGLIRKMAEAKDGDVKELNMMGDGSAIREFLYVDDAVDAIIELGAQKQDSVVNVGPGTGVTIKYLAETIQTLIGYEGALIWGKGSDNGQKEKVMVPSTTFKPKTSLIRGLKETIDRHVHATNESGAKRSHREAVAQ